MDNELGNKLDSPFMSLREQVLHVLKTPTPFREWLESFESDNVVVGYENEWGNSPLERFLHDSFPHLNMVVDVGCVKILESLNGQDEDNTITIGLVPWARYFEPDDLAPYPVTKRKALDRLYDVLLMEKCGLLVFGDELE